MIITGNLWKWPSTPDKAFYELGDIVQIISPLRLLAPEASSGRSELQL